MNNNKKVNPKSNKKNNSGSKKQRPGEWTIGSAILFLLVTFDVVIILVWLVHFQESYETITKIVGGVWVAITTLLSIVGIKKSSETSLREFLNLLPVKLIILVYTVMIFVSGYLLWRIEGKFHVVNINATLNGEILEGASVYWDNKFMGETNRDGYKTIEQIKSGEYQLSGIYGGDTLKPRHVIVKWNEDISSHDLAFKSEPHDTIPVPISEFGNLAVESNYRGSAFNGATIILDHRDLNLITPARVTDLKQKTYTLQLKKIYDDFYYEGDTSVFVAANNTREIDVALKMICRLCQVKITSEPKEANIYIDDVPKGTTGTHGKIIKLPPGEYRIRLEKDGRRIDDSFRITPGQSILPIELTL